MTNADSMLQVFQDAAPRMADLPLYNAALKPALYHWQQVAGAEAGILVAPWCINLVWCRDEPGQWPLKGEVCVLSLESGEYQGVVAQSDALGFYGSASLVSDTLALIDQAEAETLVEELAALIFAQPQQSGPVEPVQKAENPQRRALFRRMLGGSA